MPYNQETAQRMPRAQLAKMRALRACWVVRSVREGMYDCCGVGMLVWFWHGGTGFGKWGNGKDGKCTGMSELEIADAAIFVR